MQDAGREPVYGLDFIRLGAALLVVFYHFGFKAWATPGNPLLKLMALDPATPAWTGAAWWGWVGVQIFFVISGAVIAYSSEGVTPADFARRRAARLWPTLLICSLFALAVAVLSFGAAPAQALLFWLKTIVFFPYGPWIMGQFWTLPVEVVFYALFWALIVVRRAGDLETIAWCLAGVSAVYWAAYTSGFAPAGRATELLLLQHGCYFALGIMLARAPWGALRLRHGAFLALCAATAALQIRVAAGWEVQAYPELAAPWLAPYAAWLTAVALIASSFAFKREVAAALAGWDRPVRLIGLVTYPLYLIHIHAGGPALVAASRFGLDLKLCVGVGVVVSVVAALVVAAVLEPPLHRLTSAALGGRRRAAPAFR